MGGEGIAAQLEFAWAERAQGHVVLGVLAGPTDRAAEHWRRWAAHHRRFVLATEFAAREPALTELVAQAPWLRVLPGARAHLARAAELSQAELGAAISARGDTELASWLDELAGDDPVTMVAAWLVRSTRASAPTPAPVSTPALLAALERLAAPVALLWSTPNADAAWLDQALRTAGELTLRAPTLPIAVAAPRQAVERIAPALAGSALGSLVRRGRVDVDDEVSPEPSGLGRQNASNAAPLDRAKPQRGGGATEGPSAPSSGRRARAGAPSASQGTRPEAPWRGVPRSQPEAALYTALEQDPRTRGYFALNQRVQLPGGLRELDLLAAPVRLAVEIDGWHHFREPAQYRIDRHKDVRLQRGDYFVMRFLAEDIQGDRLAYTVDEIACILLELSSDSRTPPPRGDTR